MQSIVYSLEKSPENIKKLESTGTAELDRFKSSNKLLNTGLISMCQDFPIFDIFRTFSGLSAIDFTQSASAAGRTHMKC